MTCDTGSNEWIRGEIADESDIWWFMGHSIAALRKK